jgi:hypothetical protein
MEIKMRNICVAFPIKEHRIYSEKNKIKLSLPQILVHAVEAFVLELALIKCAVHQA